MFKVEYLHQNVTSITPLISGTTFGFFDKKLVFKVTSSIIPAPLLINFHVLIDDAKPFAFSVGKIVNNELDIKFSLQNKNSSGGIAMPMSLFVIDNKLLAFMFYVEDIQNDKVYKLTYEFYDGTLPSASEKGGPK